MAWPVGLELKPGSDTKARVLKCLPLSPFLDHIIWLGFPGGSDGKELFILISDIVGTTTTLSLWRTFRTYFNLQFQELSYLALIFGGGLWHQLGFPDGSGVKNIPAMQEAQEMPVWSLGQEDPLGEEMATHSSILAWKIPWKRGIRSTGSQGVGHNWRDRAHIQMQIHETSENLLYIADHFKLWLWVMGPASMHLLLCSALFTLVESYLLWNSERTQ